MSKETTIYTEEACRQAAEAADLTYVRDTDPGILRKRCGKGFMYLSPNQERITDEATLERIQSLAIPPAYTSVWICTDEKGHLQATGRDEKKRKQYRYHPKWEAMRSSNKFNQMSLFAEALPQIREQVEKDMRLLGLPRKRVLATIVNLIDITHIRIGNAQYAEENKSYGITTLRKKHVHVEGNHIYMEFIGKSGKEWKLDLNNRRIAGIIRRCEELPGYQLFKYIDEDGKRHLVSSEDVNAYLQEITGKPITAKDFRTWAATAQAITALTSNPLPTSKREIKRQLNETIRGIALHLGHTAVTCRTAYVHPQVVQDYMEGKLHAWHAKQSSADDYILVKEYIRKIP